MKRSIGLWGSHHKLHGLTEDDFPGFEYSYMNEWGAINRTPHDDIINLLIMKWESK